MSAVYSIYTSPNHAPIPNHLPTLIVTPHGQPHHTLYSYIHTNFNRETYLLTPSPQGDLCVAKMIPPPGSRTPAGGGSTKSDPGHPNGGTRSVHCEASRNLKWTITNTGVVSPIYKLTLPNPDSPSNEQPLFQISKPNPNATFWTMFYFTYAGHLIPPKRVEFGKIQKNATVSSSGGTASSAGGGTRVTITGKTEEEKAVWQTLGEGNEDMVEWIVLCAALNLLDDEIIKAGGGGGGGGGGTSGPGPGRSVPSSRSPQPQPPRSPIYGPNAGAPGPGSGFRPPPPGPGLQARPMPNGYGPPPPGGGGGGYPMGPPGGPAGPRPPRSHPHPHPQSPQALGPTRSLSNNNVGQGYPMPVPRGPGPGPGPPGGMGPMAGRSPVNYGGAMQGGGAGPPRGQGPPPGQGQGRRI